MSQPRVSVLMSVHNGQDFLREAIDSILNQTFHDLELIVVDDASTDNSPMVLKTVSDPRLRIISFDKNVGLVDALNCALIEARGELIARMDADDVAFPGRLAAQVERMLTEPNLVLLGTAYNYIDARGQLLRHQPVNTDNETLQMRLIAECNQFCHPSVLMRASAVNSLGGYRKLAGRYAQDYDLWLRLAERGVVANLPETLMSYRVHGEQLSVKNLFPQRRAAEIYKALARQRRLSGLEDFTSAANEVDASTALLRNAVAADCLHWSDIFFLMGDHARSREMQIKAIWTSPFSPHVRRMIRKGLIGRLRTIGRGN